MERDCPCERRVRNSSQSDRPQTPQRQLRVSPRLSRHKSLQAAQIAWHRNTPPRQLQQHIFFQTLRCVLLEKLHRVTRPS